MPSRLGYSPRMKHGLCSIRSKRRMHPAKSREVIGSGRDHIVIEIENNQRASASDGTVRKLGVQESGSAEAQTTSHLSLKETEGACIAFKIWRAQRDKKRPCFSTMVWFVHVRRHPEQTSRNGHSKAAAISASAGVANTVILDICVSRRNCFDNISYNYTPSYDASGYVS